MDLTSVYARKRHGRKQMKTNKRYFYDVILIALLLIVFLSLYFFVYKKDDTGAVAIVYLENEVIGEYPLSLDGEYSLNGGTNIIKIEDGEAYMLYANCPDGWCKNQGKIAILGERITCLPNRVMIVIEGGE